MSNAALFASVIGGMICLTHVCLGGREAARPLLGAKDLTAVPRLTVYYCWHLVTIVLALMSVGYAYLSQTFEFGLAWGLLITSGLFACLSIGLIIKYRVNPLWLPQWILFLILAVCGIAVVAGY